MALGSEMLFRAHYYFGHQLKTRGVNVQILPSNEVISEGMRIAKELAEKPLASLKLLKRHLAEPIRKDLITIIEQEKSMHEISMKLPEVKELVENNFYN
jgi:hypothetical protein